MNSHKYVMSLADAAWEAQASSNCPANVLQFWMRRTSFLGEKGVCLYSVPDPSAQGC